MHVFYTNEYTLLIWSLGTSAVFGCWLFASAVSWLMPLGQDSSTGLRHGIVWTEHNIGVRGAVLVHFVEAVGLVAQCVVWTKHTIGICTIRR
jgi:hypothetical protein